MAINDLSDTIKLLQDRIDRHYAEIDILTRAVTALRELEPEKPKPIATIPLRTVKDIVVKHKKKAVDNRDRVLDFLKSGPKTGAEITIELMRHGTIRKTAHNAIYYLKKHDYIMQEASGHYSLSPEGEKP
jgi:hypothetical protein